MIALANQKAHSNWMNRKTIPTYILSIEDSYFCTYAQKKKKKRWEMVFQPKENQKKAGIDILIADKTDFKPKNVTKDKEGHL